MIDQKQLDQALHALSSPNKRNYQQIKLSCSIVDELAWLASQSHPIQGFWKNRAGVRHCYIGIFRQAGTLEQLEQLKQQFPQSRFYGGLSFDPQTSQWPGFGPLRFILPRIELICHHDTPQLIIHCWLSDENREAEIRSIRQEIAQLSEEKPLHWQPVHATFVGHLPTIERWRKNVSQICQETFSQHTHKVVLARASTWQLAHPLNTLALMQKWQQTEPDNYAFWLRYDSHRSFFGVTPERLYLRQQQQFYSEALAGTCRIGTDEQHSLALAQQLLNDAKNIHENQFVVDAIQQQLESFTAEVTIAPLTIRRQSQVQHLSRAIEAQLHSKVTDQMLISALHPTPAVCGHPRQNAYQFLRQNEPFERGWYAGVVGCISAETAELAVAIRSAMQDGDELTTYAGAGIIKASQAELEWHELNQKTAALQGILHG
ncbi:isochorismate synthase MenF [Celerinatantimonas sp. YJH-8]|uniref:isochorismate synthase n=1 Tax=Celerinatantimonas sp. YJH-8 TaxID=3228714 RepID=UPI0038C47BA9